MSSVDQSFEMFLRHERKGATSELDSVDVFTPISQEVVEISISERSIVRASDLCAPLRARLFWDESIGGKEGERSIDFLLSIWGTSG